MKTLHRFFFAVRPPPLERERIGAIRDGLEALHRHKIANHRLHLTLGVSEDYASYPGAVVAQMRSIGDRVRTSPAGVVLDQIAYSPASIALRPRRRPQSLHDLAVALGMRLDRDGLRRRSWRFSPHVTLGYCSGSARLCPITPVGWTADEYVLIHSWVGETRHEVLARWPLDPMQGELL